MLGPEPFPCAYSCLRPWGLGLELGRLGLGLIALGIGLWRPGWNFLGNKPLEAQFGHIWPQAAKFVKTCLSK